MNRADVYLGNGASELIVMSMNALLNDGDEILLPAPDYPLYTAGVALSGGTPMHYVCDEQSGWLVASWDDPNGSGGITTQGQDLRDLQHQVTEAVAAYFDEGEAPAAF